MVHWLMVVVHALRRVIFCENSFGGLEFDADGI